MDIIDRQTTPETAAKHCDINVYVFRLETEHFGNVVVRSFGGLCTDPELARIFSYISDAVHCFKRGMSLMRVFVDGVEAGRSLQKTLFNLALAASCKRRTVQRFCQFFA